MLRASPCSAGAAAGRGPPKAAVRPTAAAGKGPAFFHQHRRRRRQVAASSSSSAPRPPSRPLTSSSSSSSSSLATPRAAANAAASTLPSPSFDWAANWYPVGSVLSTLDPSKPNKVTLLQRSLVVWLDGSGEGEGEGGEGPEESPSSSASPSWRAAVDECPHRLAAMSDGRLEKGVLSCRYHGAKKKPKREFFLIFLDFFLLFSLRFSTHKKKKKKKKNHRLGIRRRARQVHPVPSGERRPGRGHRPLVPSRQAPLFPL